MNTFTDWLENADDNYGIFNSPMSDKECIQLITNYLLGENWYVTSPVSHDQVNTERVFQILNRYSRRFKKEWKMYVKGIKKSVK